MAKTIDLREYLRYYCIDLGNMDTMYVLKRLGINVNTIVCARCTYPFSDDAPPAKIALVSEEDMDEIYMVFCDHCDKYIRNSL